MDRGTGTQVQCPKAAPVTPEAGLDGAVAAAAEAPDLHV